MDKLITLGIVEKSPVVWKEHFHIDLGGHLHVESERYNVFECYSCEGKLVYVEHQGAFYLLKKKVEVTWHWGEVDYVDDFNEADHEPEQGPAHPVYNWMSDKDRDAALRVMARKQSLARSVAFREGRRLEKRKRLNSRRQQRQFRQLERSI
jgi:hypothetical protein